MEDGQCCYRVLAQRGGRPTGVFFHGYNILITFSLIKSLYNLLHQKQGYKNYSRPLLQLLLLQCL
jgi:hypothetical protein